MDIKRIVRPAAGPHAFAPIDAVPALDVPLSNSDEVLILQALSGG